MFCPGTNTFCFANRTTHNVTALQPANLGHMTTIFSSISDVFAFCPETDWKPHHKNKRFTDNFLDGSKAIIDIVSKIRFLL